MCVCIYMCVHIHLDTLSFFLPLSFFLSHTHTHVSLSLSLSLSRTQTHPYTHKPAQIKMFEQRIAVCGLDGYPVTNMMCTFHLAHTSSYTQLHTHVGKYVDRKHVDTHECVKHQACTKYLDLQSTKYLDTKHLHTQKVCRHEACTHTSTQRSTHKCTHTSTQRSTHKCVHSPHTGECVHAQISMQISFLPNKVLSLK